MKFGGTSVAGAERMLGTAAIVAARRVEAPVVVTSAMAGVTNELTRLHDVALSGDRDALDAGCDALRARHREVADIVAPQSADLVERLEGRLRELRVLLRGIRLIGATTPRSRDAVLGFGELLAQELLVAALARAGVDARHVDARDVVVTDATFGAARPDLEETRARAGQRVMPLVREGAVPVLGGYLGATEDGVPTTLGRGGSDLSASFIGLALQANAVEIWTDVDGMMTADPRQVPQARLVDRVTFREAAEFAAFGAKVLHPASIDPAIQGGLPVIIRNSLAPERSGTAIGPSGEGAPGARAIVSMGGLALATLRAPERLRGRGFIGDVVARLEELGASPFHLAFGPVGLETALVDGENLPRAIEWLGRQGPVSVRGDLAAVSVVGEKLVADVLSWARVLEIAADFRCLRLFQQPRGTAIGVLVERDDMPQLVRALHRRLIEESGGTS